MAPTDPPGERLYTIDEVAALLRMEKRTLRRLIRAGEFPRPQYASKGLQVWSADDVAYYRLRMALRPRLRPSKPSPAPAKPAKRPRPE